MNVFEAVLKYGHDEDFAPSSGCGVFVATDHPPGSEEKIKVMAERAENGHPIWHPDDRTGCEGLPPGYLGVRRTVGHSGERKPDPKIYSVAELRRKALDESYDY